MNTLLGGSYGVLRHSEFVNFQTQPGPCGRQYGSAIGAAYELYNGRYLADAGHHFVIYNNVIRDSGHYLSTADNKAQGIKFGGVPGVPGTSYIWILNNIFYRNGQGMQHGDDCIGSIVNGQCQADLAAWPHHFYIGFNELHDKRKVDIALI